MRRLDASERLLRIDIVLRAAAAELADGDQRVVVVRSSPDGTIEVVVGTGTIGAAADGMAATEVGVLPSDVALAPDGAILFSQSEPEPAVRRVDPETGIVSTLFR